MLLACAVLSGCAGMGEKESVERVRPICEPPNMLHISNGESQKSDATKNLVLLPTEDTF